MMFAATVKKKIIETLKGKKRERKTPCMNRLKSKCECQVNAWYPREGIPVATTHIRQRLSVMENPLFHFEHLCGDWWYY